MSHVPPSRYAAVAVSLLEFLEILAPRFEVAVVLRIIGGMSAITSRESLIGIDAAYVHIVLVAHEKRPRVDGGAQRLSCSCQRSQVATDPIFLAYL